MTTFSFRHIIEIDANDSTGNLEAFLAEVRENHHCPGNLQTWELVMLTILMVFGVLFNGFILATFIHLPRIRNFTNHFVASLALADMLLVIFSPVLSLLLFFEKVDFQTGETIRFNSKIFFSLASMFSFASISVDRMLAITKPLYHRTLPRSCCVKVIVFIWILSVLGTVFDNVSPKFLNIFVVTCVNFVIGYFIPTAITITSYAVIAKVVVGRKKEDLQATHRHDGQNRRQTLRITGKILMVIVPGTVMWSIFWVPIFIHFTHDHEEELFPHSFIEAVTMVPDLTALVNPLTFIVMTTEFRNYLIKSVCRRT